MRSKVLLAPLYLFFLSSSFAQTTSSFDLTKYISTISISDLKTHLEIVASDEMEGRDT
ncbi:MAG: peptidase M28, partial [Flavobacteriia bacterium]|nr:peptidase M28 [Flavobacteriia bacterium]